MSHTHSLLPGLAGFLVLLSANAAPAQGPGAALHRTPAALQPASPILPDAVAVDRLADSATIWVRGERYKASIDAEALTYIPFLGTDAQQNLPLRFQLSGAEHAGRRLDITAGEITHVGTQITVQRAAFAEVYDAQFDGLKQTFRFDRLDGARGDLCLTLDVAGEATLTRDGDDIVLTGDRGIVRYSDFVVFDARGTRRKLPIGQAGTQIRLEVPADFVQQAELPLFVDPVLSTVTVATLPDMRMEPDVAWNETAQEHLVVYRVPYSQTDWDVAAQRADFWMNPIGAPFWIDSTTQNWVGPRVACNRLGGIFLIVGQTSQGTTAPFSIWGRRYEAIGATRTLHARFPVQDPSLHQPGDAYAPDIGGDPSNTVGPTWITVVWEHRLPGQNGDILMRRFRADGSNATNAVVVNDGPYNDTAPSISRSNAHGPNNTGYFGIVWTQYNQPANRGDIGAVVYDHSGAVQVAPFFLETTIADDTRPRISTMATIGGTHWFFAVWQRDFDPFGGYGRLRGATFTSSLTGLQRWDLSALLGIPASTMAMEPAVDSDGTRFSIVHSETPQGSGRSNVHVSTVAPDGSQLHVHEARAVLQNSGPNAFVPAIVSRYGNSLANTRTYSIVTGSNAINVTGFVYNGHQPGSFWNLRNGGCGGLPISYGGYPLFGDNVWFDLGGTDPYKSLSLGFPTPMATIGLCPGCTFGVTVISTVPVPYGWNVPYVPSLVGMTLSAQGVSIGAGPCLGAVKISDAIDFTLR